MSKLFIRINDTWNEVVLTATSSSINNTPSTPTSVTGTKDDTAKSATISWQAPVSDGGSVITGYRVARDGMDSGGTGAWSTTVSSTTTSFTFLSLVLGSTYNMTVQGINANGEGAAALVTVTLGANTNGTPTAPVSVTAIKDDAQKSATISWQTPTSDGGSAITGYFVGRDGMDSKGGGAWSTIVSAETRAFSFLSLVAGSTYNLTVYAINANGNGTQAVATVTLTAETTTPTGQRIILNQPFPSDDLWNLSIANGAQFASATDPRTASWRNIPSQYERGVNCEKYSHPVYVATTSDPYVRITDDQAYRSSNGYIPAGAQPATGTDAHLHVLQPDGYTMLEMWAFRRVSASEVHVGRNEWVDLRTHSTGPNNGVRAYGGPAVGGLIRLWEIDPAHPNYTDGVIRHPIAWAIRPKQLHRNQNLYNGDYYYTSGTVTSSNQTRFPGWPLGHPIAGFMGQPGYVAPATEQDWASFWGPPQQSTPHWGYYEGNLPMGSLLAIPPSVDINTLGLTSSGLKLARAAQDYGIYITDASGISCCYVEVPPNRLSNGDGPSITFVNELRSNGSQDIQRIIDNSFPVTNSDYLNPGGAPRSSTDRRQPLLPPL